MHAATVVGLKECDSVNPVNIEHVYKYPVSWVSPGM